MNFSMQVSYTKAEDGSFEGGFEKVAIYVDLDLSPTHVAKQLPSGRWKSKLGKGHDIEHDTVDALEGDQMDEYGIVAQYLRRRIQPVVQRHVRPNTGADS